MNKENKNKIAAAQIPKNSVIQQRKPLKPLNTSSIIGSGSAGTSTQRESIGTVLNTGFLRDKEEGEFSIYDESDILTHDVFLEDEVAELRDISISEEETPDEFSARPGNDSNLQLNLGSEYFGNTFKYLLEREKPSPGVPNIKKRTRSCVINWIVKIHGDKGDPSPIQIAIWYLDSIVASEVAPVHKLQLFAVASYWIALKITDRSLQSSKWLARYSNANSLKNTEIIVLNTLRFPAQPVIPQDFIPYFARYCDDVNPELIESYATFICLAGMTMDNCLCSELSPSVIGAAAIRTALLILDEDLLLRLEISPLFQMVVKKVDDISMICVMLRKAIRALGHRTEYKNLIKLYGKPPAYVSYNICRVVEETDGDAV